MVLNSWELHRNLCSESPTSLKRFDEILSIFSIFFIIFGQNLGTGEVHIYFMTVSCVEVGAMTAILHLGS